MNNKKKGSIERALEFLLRCKVEKENNIFNSHLPSALPLSSKVTASNNTPLIGAYDGKKRATNARKLQGRRRSTATNEDERRVGERKKKEGKTAESFDERALQEAVAKIICAFCSPKYSCARSLAIFRRRRRRSYNRQFGLRRANASSLFYFFFFLLSSAAAVFTKATRRRSRQIQFALIRSARARSSFRLATVAYRFKAEMRGN